jgi:hypothetical protein
VLAVVLFDLYGWDWGPRNKIQQGREPEGDAMEKLLSTRQVARFLKSQPGPFRIQFDPIVGPNIGDNFGVEATNGGGVTLLKDYAQMGSRPDLLNVRYTLRPASARQPGPVYQDSAWKVYRNDNAFPRAWLVHRTETTTPQEMGTRLDSQGFDAHTTALTYTPLPIALDPPATGGSAANSVEEARFRSAGAGEIEVMVRSAGKAMLVLSEVFAPGWKATVNGKPAAIWQVDAALRGVVVPDGASRVRLTYAPTSVYAGAGVTLCALAVILFGVGAYRRRGTADRE